MEKQVIINIASEFSRMPSGRYKSDGPFSGENFREKLLVPALESADKVRIILDGARGYGSSFLEEAFGGLVRLGKWPASFIKNRLVIISESDPALIDEINEYIDDAGKRT